jgi:hypothetical protein
MGDDESQNQTLAQHAETAMHALLDELIDATTGGKKNAGDTTKAGGAYICALVTAYDQFVRAEQSRREHAPLG